MDDSLIFDEIDPVISATFRDTFLGPAWPDRFGKWLEDWSDKALQNHIRTLSLFSGAGGLDIGFHQAGFRAVDMVEFDDRFVSTLKANCGAGTIFGAANPICIDARKYSPNKLGSIDFIIGGPPCQTFSAAGRRAGGVQGTEDERGMLFWAYVKLLKDTRPKGFLFENVYGITGANSGRDWQVIRNAFEDAGYNVFYRVLDAADYGVPQHRERMFIVGLQEGSFDFPRPTHGPESASGLPHFSASNAIAGAADASVKEPVTVGGRYGHLLQEVPPGLNYSYFTERLGHPNPVFAWRSKFSDFLYKADPERPVRTIKAQGGQYTGPFHWDSRPFSTHELKRLQTFPDDYAIIGGRGAVIQQIGNSVPPQLARILAVSILEQVFGVDPPLKIPTLQAHEELGFRSRKRDLTRYYLGLAKKGQSKRQERASIEVKGRTRHIILADDFRLVDRSGHRDGVVLTFRPTKQTWAIAAGYQGCEKSDSGFVIDVRPRAGAPWSLPCASVKLKGSSLHAPVFTLAWKMFESEIQRHEIKADLVQLNGYYQYEPDIVASMQIQGRTPWAWKSLSRVVSGIGVRQTLSAEDLAEEWKLSSEKFFEFAQFLRLMGYEVRNKQTNPQIPVGYWLLPYAFPTLTPQSVQLRKELVS